MTTAVRLGSDVLLDSGRLRGSRVGVVCNPASIDHGFRHVIDRLASADGVTLAAIFGPQHGFRSDVQDNMIETPHRDDAARRVPIYSLYSETREPTAEMLRGLDRARHRSAGHRRADLHLHLHDGELPARRRTARRPGHRLRPAESDWRAYVEGESLVPGYESFVGQFPIPMRHGMTIGELARLFNEQFGIGADARGRADGGVAARHVRRRDGPALGHAVAEHADARHGGRLPGHGAVRGRDAVGGAWHDAGRSSWWARPWIDAERFARGDERAPVAGRVLPAGRVRADVSEVREAVVRRRPAPRHRSRARSAR